MTLPLSVIMISLNEAHHMRAVLRNLEGFAEQVFLVDSFSIDDTVDIALEHGVHVIQRRFRDFGDQWNFAVSKLPVRTPWVMKLDPDERITDELKATVARALEADQFDGFGFQRRLWLMGKPMPVRNNVLRIWRQGSCRFSDVIVNEHPVIEGRVSELQGEMEHHDSPNLHHWFDKQNRYSTAEAVAQFHGYQFADTPRLFGTAYQRRMWLKRHLWKLPGRFLGLYLYHLLWVGAWRAGRVGWIWARLRTERYRVQEFKQYEMRLTGHPYQDIAAGNGLPHPGAVQAEEPDPPSDYRKDGPEAIKAEQARSREAAVRHHERLARGWAERYSSGGFKRRAAFFSDRIVPHLDLEGAWLDAGCGSGYFARMLAERGSDVTGVDAATGMIGAAEALSRTHSERDHTDFSVIETIEQLPYEDESFDGIVCLSVLEYLPEPAAAMREFARVLKPGGQVVISLPNSRSPLRFANQIKSWLLPAAQGGEAFLDYSHFTMGRPEILPFFEQHGFEINSLDGFDPVLPSGLGGRAPSLFFVTATRR
ncbi:MAG: methyltransferase domain-containing protein [Paracoccaceae bacterium]